MWERRTFRETRGEKAGRFFFLWRQSRAATAAELTGVFSRFMATTVHISWGKGRDLLVPDRDAVHDDAVVDLRLLADLALLPDHRELDRSLNRHRQRQNGHRSDQNAPC